VSEAPGGEGGVLGGGGGWVPGFSAVAQGLGCGMSKKHYGQHQTSINGRDVLPSYGHVNWYL
jgi:hypothetical protein